MFLQGIILGLSIAAPVGPIGVLCIRKTLAQGRMSGLLSGLGAASADALYGAIAAFGLTMISDVLVHQQNLVRLAGGLFLAYLGVRTFLSQQRELTNMPKASNLISDFSVTFLLTLTNPMTILSFAAIFAGLGLITQAKDPLDSIFIVAGVFLGSATWWLCLSGIVSMMRKQINSVALRWINRASGMILFTFGLMALVSAF